MVQKQALDQTAKSYWEEYFGEYGRQWTRDIPRNVKSAMLDSRRRTAAGGSTELTESDVVPLGYAVTADRVDVEGYFRGTYSDGHREAKLFRAQFNHDGKLLALDTRRAPAA